MLWIALSLPELPLDLACRRWPEPLRDTVPVAVLDERRVGWANVCAREAGIEPGLPEGSARARSAEAALLARDVAAETSAIVEVALWALHFTPQVSLLPEGLLMNVSASLRLFGGKDKLLQRFRSGVVEMGLTPQIATAPVAAAACLFARHADGVDGGTEEFVSLLDRLPVALLPSAQLHRETLQAIGCETIGQLRRLPRAGVVRRFGDALLSELDRAYGDKPQAHAWYQPPAVFEASLELPSRAENSEALLFAARRLLMQMSGWLTARHAAVTRFTLKLHHESLSRGRHPVTTVAVAFGKPSRDLAHLSLLLNERLVQTTLPASVLALSLHADRVEPFSPMHEEMFPTPAMQEESVSRLVERLASRLGNGAVSRIVAVADHRPERASALLAACIEGDARHRRFEVEIDPFCARPSWLLDKPLPLIVRRHRPCYQSPLMLLAGPERIEAGWWDDAPVTRDYFIASNDEHLLLWIYRERPRPHSADESWFLHGFFG